MATLKDIPIFRVGKHKGRDVTEGDLDEMVFSGNHPEVQAFLTESRTTGNYEGNEALNEQLSGTKHQRAGWINLGHNRFFASKIMDWVKDVSISWSKKMIKGVQWAVATLDNVDPEIAEYIEKKASLRSVELIPKLYIPKLNQWFKNVPRSIGFLDKHDPDEAPAVSGQSSDLQVSYSEGFSLITLFSEVDKEPTQTEENNIMADEIKTQDSPKEGVTMEKYQEMLSRVEALEAQNKTQTERADRAEKAFVQEKQAREAQAIDMYVNDLMHSRNLAPKVREQIKALVAMTSDNILIKFGEEEKTSRQVFESILDAAKDGSLFVPMGELAGNATTNGKSEGAPKTMEEALNMEKYAAIEDLGDRWTKAAKDYPYLAYAKGGE